MKWYNLLSAPLAMLYGAGVLLRNGLYKTKLLYTHHVSVPTICVGNLAVGGTGKTPFVEYLCRMLSPHYQVAVLSRGYRRQSRGFVLADAQSSALTIGDEPMQIHAKFPDIPVAVCRDRIEGIHRLQMLFPHLQVVILDDAFQYRKLRCGFNILLTAYNNLYIDDHFLPLGTLRDSCFESLRAAAIVVTKCPPTMRPIDQRIVDTKLHLPTFQQLFFSRIEYPEIPQNKKILLLTGIANPEYILQQVRQYNPSTCLMAYPDHHRFSAKEIDKIAEASQLYDIVLTTEKDFVRLQAMTLPPTLLNKLRSLPITISLTEPENLERAVRQYINENLQPKK